MQINYNKLYSSFSIHGLMLFISFYGVPAVEKRHHKGFFQINLHLFISKNRTSGDVLYIGFGFF